MARFLDNKKDIDKQVKKKKKEETAAKKPQSSSASVEKVNKRLSEKYSGGSTGGKVSKPSTPSSQNRITQKSYGTTKPTITQRTTSGSTAQRQQNAERNNNLKQTMGQQARENRISRLEEERQQRQAQQEKARRTTGAVNRRLSQKYGENQVTGGRRTKLDSAADYTRDVAKGAWQGAKLAATEDAAFLNRFSNESSGNKFWNRELNKDDYDKNMRRMELRQEGWRKKIKDQQEAMQRTAEESHGRLGRLGIEAAQSAGGMAVDAMFGPFSLVHMGARVTEGAQGDVIEKAEPLKERMRQAGYSEEEINESFKGLERADFANAIMQGTIEGLTEKMFGGIGLAAKVGGKGYLDRAIGKLAGGRLGSGIAGRVARGTLEEIAEEEVGNPAQALASNVIYGNKFQGINEDIARRSLDELMAASANVDSEDFYKEARNAFKESGSSDEEANELAEMARRYLQAQLSGDSETAQSYQDQMVKRLTGGENSLKEKWTLQDAIDVGLSTAMMTVATGVPGALTTAAIGSTYKEETGMDGVRKLTEMVKNLDPDNSTKAQAILDRIDAGEDISNTQVYDVMDLSSKAAAKAKEREAVKNRLSARQMQEEDLLVQPAVITRAGYQLGEATAQRFEEISDKVLDRVGEGSEDSYAIADAVAAYETGTITAEQMNALNVENPENRTVFQEMTGIDLNQFNVTDSRGKIDEAASNTKMQTALFANAAENYVQSARIEQENWNDKVRGMTAEAMSPGLGSEGDIAFQKAMESVDPRDRSKFILTDAAARRVYEYARNTTDEWSDVRRDFRSMFKGVDESVLRDVFDAAKKDKTVAETQYYGQIVNRNSLTSDVAFTAGKFRNGSQRPLGNTELSTLSTIASELGVDVIMSDALDANENGRYSPKQRTITLNAANSMGDNLSFVFSHEVTHHLAAYAPDEYIKLSRFIMDTWYKNNEAEYNAEIEKIQRLYKEKKDRDLSPEQALEEIIANNAHNFWADEEFVDAVTRNEPTLAQSIINAIREFLRKLRNILASETITDERTREGLFAEIGAYDEAYRMWLDAFNAAKKARADEAIADLQERIYEEESTRHSISDDESTRHSISDADYMAAVERGDMETAQRMVDEAAARSMPRTKLTGRWYHGTENEFTEFNFSQGGKNGHADGYGIYLTNDPEVASSYGNRMIEGYVNVERPASALTTATLTKSELHRLIKRTVDNEAETLQSEGYDSVDQAKFDTWISNYTDTYYAGNIDKAIDEVIDAITNINGNDYDIVLEIMTGMGIRNYEEASAFYDILTEETGIDGFETKWGDESEMADPNTPTIALAFRSEQIKDAAPVTYDDEGNVIPLSERFDLSNPDIRYSLTTDKEDFVKGANLSKELRDWAKEVGLDKLSKQPIKGPVIVSVRDLRSAWYEKNGRSDEAEAINTALDKIGDSLTQLVGEYQYIDLGDAINAAVTYRTDAEGHPTSVILSCQVKNAEYEVNFDFTTICAKRLAMQKVLERFIKTEGERQGTTLYDELKLDEEGLYKLRLILETAGFDVSCRGCFVEQNRYSQQNQARTIANDWNAALDEWAKENGTEVTENFGLTNLDVDSLDYEEIEAGFERYHELMKGQKTDVATKNRMLIEASPFFRKRMNASDYASMAGQRALMAIGESKKGGTNLYGLLKRGQSDSKQSVPFTAYNGEIALLPDNMKGKSLYDYLLSIGGARAQSASDFQIEFVYDYMQMAADLSARGLPMHMYTKVIELAELFGMTGIKINLSAMCDVADDLGGEYAGLKLVDGKYEYNISDQSIDYKKAVDLQKRDGYSKNIGIIMVALSSQHMLKSLDDPDVRYIIGYHSSAMPVVVANMSNMGGATDYTKINKTNKLNEKGQALFDEAMKEAKGETKLEKYKNALRIFDQKIQEETAKKKKKPRRGNEYGAYMSAYGNNTADFNTYDSLLKTKDARKTADKYLEHCMKNGLIPIYFPFAFHENYYKCEIYDFNMYDNNTGEYAPMESVQNIYPGLNMAAGETDTTAFMERVSQIMDEQNRTNKALDSQYDAVFDEAKDELRYSITGDDYMDFDASRIDHSELTHRADAIKSEAQLRDEAYMSAVNSGNMEETQRLVDEAAERAGYKTKAYHGTPWGGFTEFSTEFLHAGRTFGNGIYLTSSPTVAEGYTFPNARDYAKIKAGEEPTPQVYGLFIKDLPNALVFDWENYTYNGRKVKGVNSKLAMIRMDIEAEPDKDVVIRNIRDGSEELSDVYVIKNSSSLKSADPVTYADDGSVIPLSERFNPENDDIRYSLSTQDSDGNIIPSDTEVKDRIIATSDDIDRVPLVDPVLEENRIRYSIAADDFIASVKTDWDKREHDFSKGIKDTPLKNKLVKLLKDARNNSGTERKYSSETLKRTIKSVERMYKSAKQGNIDDFAKEAWAAAERIVDDINYNDSLFEQYKGLRNILANTNIKVPEALAYGDYAADVAEFVRENGGRMKLREYGMEIEDIYAKLHKKFPEMFPDDIEHPIDMLMQMDYILDYIEPYKDAYTSEEYSKLVEDIANNLCQIIDQGDEYKATIDTLKVEAMKVRHEEALRKVRTQTISQKNRAEAWKQKYEQRVAKDAQTRSEKRERKEHKDKFERIRDNYNDLVKWVLKPGKNHYVPEEFRKSLAEVLQAFDLQTENSKKLEEMTGHPALKTLKLRELKEQLEALSKKDGGSGTPIFDIDSYIPALLDALIDKLDKYGNSIDSLNAHDIKEIDRLLASIKQNIKNYNNLVYETKMVPLIERGNQVIEDQEHIKKRDGVAKKYEGGIKGSMKDLNVTSLTPTYLFDRLGPGMKQMYDELRYDGFDKYIRNEAVIIDRLSDILGGYYKRGVLRKKRPKPGSELQEWRDDRSAQDITLESGETVRMTVAQIMSLYCLYNRDQARLHMIEGGGIHIVPIQVGAKIAKAKGAISGKKYATEGRNYRISTLDAENIIAKLTPEQKHIADQLQELMAKDMAKLGNEAHRMMYGYEIFDDPNYFPIKSHGTEIPTDINDINQVYEKIKSFGPAKPLDPKARNIIEIDDIFTITADHCNGMNLYNAYLVPISNFMKVYNYKTMDANVKEELTQAHGDEVMKYLSNFLSDLNGIKQSTRGGLNDIIDRALGRAKVAAVFGNIRVALQQPTAIIRALMEVDAKYFTPFLNVKLNAVPVLQANSRKEIYDEMYKYCPIALWKSWGYYDTYMGRDIEDVMMNNWSKREVALAGVYGKLDNATWSAIWQAVKAEQHDKHPDMDVKSEEFLKMCGRRASEVFDKTQVVDSTFHRSDAMRNKDRAVKALTAFMSEPTLTLNMLRGAFSEAHIAAAEGHKGKAYALRAKAIGVFLLQAAVVSAAQAFADAWRDKDPGWPGDDDDDDEKALGYWERWLHNFVADLFDQLHLENNVYLVKDVTPYINYILSKITEPIDDVHPSIPWIRALLGWDSDYLYSNNNIVMSSLEDTARGIEQVINKKEKGEEYDKEWYDIIQKTLSGPGTLFGFPIGTLMKDFKPMLQKVTELTFAADGSLMDRFGGSSDDDSSSEDSSDGYAGDYTDEQKAEIEKAAKKHQESGQTESRDAEQMLFDAEKAAAGYEGEERNKKIWQSVTKGYTGYIEAADWGYIQQMRDTIEAAGGDVDYFDQQVLEKTKSSFKKSLTYDQSDEDFVKMLSLRQYLTTHGMTEEQISSEIVYKSEIAKDMKVAFRINDENAMREALQPLADAGMTQTDLERLWDNRNRMDLVKYKNDGGRFADRLKSTGTFIWPAQGTITSEFGYRKPPTAGASANHPAIDIGAAQGSPVVASDGGTVIYAGSNGGYGNSVGIKHDNGMVTYYNHLYSWSVKVGDTVAQGQTIAQVGSTGKSTGPHLDFKVLDANGEPVNPMDYLS